MAPSFWQILLVLVLIVLLFGRGKISQLMGDVATGIKSFKKGLTEDEDERKAVADKSEDATPAASAAHTETKEAARH